VEFPAREIVDPGFLELVRYGILAPGDSLVEDSLSVVDRCLRVETPAGPCWHRYNHDGYGQRDDGGPFEGFGRGRAWPLLTGERGHYELASGRDVAPYVRALEGFATSTGLLPEQVWDSPDRPDLRLFLGGPTGSAMPLLWAHAEYVKLLKSRHDGEVFDLVPEALGRYRTHSERPRLEIWKTNRRPRRVPAGGTLRVIAQEPFRLRSTKTDWRELEDRTSQATDLGVHFVDLEIERDRRGALELTFYWTGSARWDGKNYRVAIAAPAAP
jgi:glucoamylase